MPGRRILVVAGEASSDAHAAGLIHALRRCGLEASFYGVGGAAMAEAGVDLIASADELAVVGLVEALGVLPRALRLLRRIGQALRADPPDLFLPVDSPEFNLRLLPAAARHQVPVVYFIAPQLWAWRPGRVRQLRDRVRELLVLFPFEEAWFRERGVAATYIGHPLVEAVRAHHPPARLGEKLGLKVNERLGLLLPGSRPGEIRRHLPILARAAEKVSARIPRMRWAVRMADAIDETLYRRAGADESIALSRADLFDLASVAAVTVAVSGTASFEAALTGTPLIVVYRVNRLTWWLARRLVRVPHVAMANLTAGRALVPELLQDACSPERIAGEVVELLSDEVRRGKVRTDLLGLREAFGPAGAYDRGAARVMAHLGEV